MLTACLVAAALAAGVTGAWSPCGFSMVETLAPARLRAPPADLDRRLAHVRAGRARRRGADLRRPGAARRGARGTGARRPRRRRRRRRGRGRRRGARAADRPADPPPGPRGVAARAARPARRGGLRRAARPRASPRSSSRSPSGRWPARAWPRAIRPSARRWASPSAPGARCRSWRWRRWAPAARSRAAMCERPAILRGLRRIDAVALVACAVALGTAPRVTFTLFASGAYDPTAAAGPARVAAGRRRRGDPARRRRRAAAGEPPGAGRRADRLAGERPDHDRRRRRPPLRPSATPPRTPACWRSATGCWRGARAIPSAPTGCGCSARTAAGGCSPRSLAPEQLGRPAITGGRILCHVAGPRGSALLSLDPASGGRTVLRREPGAMLSNPASDGLRLLYVRATGRDQQLRLGALTPVPVASDLPVLVHPSSGQRDLEHEPRRSRHRHGTAPPGAAAAGGARRRRHAVEHRAGARRRLRHAPARPRGQSANRRAPARGAGLSRVGTARRFTSPKGEGPASCAGRPRSQS